MTDSPKLNLRQKLIQVYTDIDHVEKTGRNNKQNYNFVRAADVLRSIRTSFAALGIYAETNYELLGTYDIKTNSGSIMHTATVKATIRLYDADSDETMTVGGLGDGADTGDKGIYKAMTGATKNALRNAFLLPDEANPEADETVDTRTQDAPPDFQEARHVAPRPVAAPQEAPLPPPFLGSTIGNLPPEITQGAGREPGDEDDDALPTEDEMTAYRSKFSKLGDDLSTAGKLKSSCGKPINRKLLVFLLQITGAGEAKAITSAQWTDFFRRADAVRVSDAGLIGLAKLVDKANGEETKK